LFGSSEGFSVGLDLFEASTGYIDEVHRRQLAYYYSPQSDKPIDLDLGGDIGADGLLSKF